MNLRVFLSFTLPKGLHSTGPVSEPASYLTGSQTLSYRM